MEILQGVDGVFFVIIQSCYVVQIYGFLVVYFDCFFLVFDGVCDFWMEMWGVCFCGFGMIEQFYIFYV